MNEKEAVHLNEIATYVESKIKEVFTEVGPVEAYRVLVPFLQRFEILSKALAIELAREMKKTGINWLELEQNQIQ